MIFTTEENTKRDGLTQDQFLSVVGALGGIEIGIQGPHLWAKPCLLGNKNIATSKRSFLDLKLYVLRLAIIHKIEGTLL